MNRHLVAAACFSCLFLQTTDLVTAQTKEIISQTNINRERADKCYRKAVFLDQTGNTEAALANYERAIALNPYHDSAYVNRGIIYGRRVDAPHR